MNASPLLRPSGMLLMSALAAACPPAQIPAGFAVVASFRPPASLNRPGTGGIWSVHPLNVAPAVPITGLPGWVTGCQWPAAQYAGTDFVLHLPDGRLMTNGWPWPLPATPTPMTVGVLTLSGTAVASVQTWDIGTILPSSFLGVPQAALLPDGRVLLALDRIGATGQPLAGRTLAILDPAIAPGTPGVVNPAPVPLGGWTMPATQAVNALAIDSAGTTAWFATNDVATGSSSWIYRAQVGTAAPGVAPVLVASLPGTWIRSLAFDAASGTLIAGGGGVHLLVRCQPATGALTPIPFPAEPNAIAVEPATGDFLIATSYPGPETVWRLPAGAAAPVALASGPPAGFAGCPGALPGWATLGGLDVVPTHRRLGPGVAGAVSDYDWNLTPSPNALPFIGNPAFGLTLQSTTGAVAGWLGLATAALPSPLVVGPGIPIYLDPATAVLFDLPAAFNIPIGPFAIPPGLGGVTFHLQSLHFDGAASAGLSVTII